MSDTPPALPSFTSWPTFPFEGDLHVRKLDDPVSEEPPRHGEDPSECRACQAPDEAYIWVSERWRVRSLDRPTGLPMVVILESRSHLDLGDLTNMLAAELGVLTVRLERAVRSLDGVARVHVNRWGDGSAHLHLWFMARPLGRLQLRGTFLSLWDEILAPIPEAQWRENLALVAAWLEEFGGRALAEPPRIDWQAPAHLGDLPTMAGAEDDEPPVVEATEQTGDAARHEDGPEPGAGDGETEAVAGDDDVAMRDEHVGADDTGADPVPDQEGERTGPGVRSETPTADEAGVPAQAHTPGDPADADADAGEPDAAGPADELDADATRTRDGVARVAIPAQGRPAAEDSTPVRVTVGAPDDDGADANGLDDASVANRSGRPVRGSRKRRLRRR